MISQATKRVTSLALSLALIVVSLIVYVGFVIPAYRSAQEVRAKQLSRRNFLVTQQSVVEQVQELVASFKGGQDHKLQDAISLSFPLGPDVAGAFVQLNGIAAIHHMAPRSFSATLPAVQNLARDGVGQVRGGGSETASGLVKPTGLVNIKTRFVGDYDAFKGVLGNIETNIRVLDIQSLTVQSIGDPDRNRYAFDLSILAYYQAE